MVLQVVIEGRPVRRNRLFLNAGLGITTVSLYRYEFASGTSFDLNPVVYVQLLNSMVS